MKTSFLLLAAAVSVITAVACHKDTDKPAEGPMERAGKSVDNGASRVKEETKEAAGKAGDDAKDAKDTVKKKATDAGL
jgi:hypothetical protein